MTSGTLAPGMVRTWALPVRSSLFLSMVRRLDRVTDDEVVDAVTSRDMDFKFRPTRGIMSSAIRDRTKSVPTGTALVSLLHVRLAAVLYRFRWVLICSD